MFKVLVSDNLSTEGVKILEAAEGIEVDVNVGLSPAELLEVIPAYHGLIIRSATKVTAAVLAAANNLRVVGRAGVGVDNIDIAAASKKGVVVMNTPDGNTLATAEHTVSMILSLMRNIPQANASLRAGKWDRKKYTGRELNGKVLGIIGLGRIGTEVVKRLKAFNMSVLAYDPFTTAERAKVLGVERAALDQIFTEADVITVHTPMTADTKHLINDAAIAKMKAGVVLVNCARGGIIEEAALVRGLKSGKISGAAIDVYESEPTDNTELVGLPNTVCVPHLGASTSEAQVSVAVDVAHQVIDYLINDNPKNALNIPAIPADQLLRIKPFIGLAEVLGQVSGQLIGGPIKKIDIEFSGTLAAENTTPVTVAVLKGIFSRSIGDESVNFVNAPYIAKEHGIKVSEHKNNQDIEFTSLLRIVTHDENDNYHSVAGTIFGVDLNRIVEIDSFHMDIEPTGQLLVCLNNDAPGIIGKVGTILGDEGLNIAAMQYSRNEERKEALAVFRLDSSVPDSVLSKLEGVDQILTTKSVSL